MNIVYLPGEVVEEEEDMETVNGTWKFSGKLLF